jgi:23S rRNA pseudouridine2605 synthase
MEERLQKIIARAGFASRRRAEAMIESGLVTVNGVTITELGSKADLSRDHIKVAGKLIRVEPKHVYYALHKPPEVVATMSDPEGRRSLRDLLGGIPERVFPIGRLEYHASGIVLLTNDGDLANAMMKARRLPKTFEFKLKSLLTFAELEQVGRSTRARISRIRGKDAPWYEATFSDPTDDALRNRLFQTGHPVEKMKRVAIGDVSLGSLTPGQHRPLTEAEVASLRRAIQAKGDAIARGPAPKTAAQSARRRAANVRRRPAKRK